MRLIDNYLFGNREKPLLLYSLNFKQRLKMIAKNVFQYVINSLNYCTMQFYNEKQ